MKKFVVILLFILNCKNLFSQNVGIGATDPAKAKLVVRGSVGAAAAMFGDTTTGVTIENNYPGIALNSYFFNGRKTIAKGYGGLAGMNPNNGDFHIYSSDTLADAGANLPMSLRMMINKKGNVGLQGVSDPKMPLSFANSIGNKISLWGSDDSVHYGLGIQGGQLQMYSASAGTNIAFGYGSSVKFTENMRIKGTGEVGIGTNNPSQGKLVVRGTIGATSAVFGDTTFGVAIENNHPGIAFNSYFNNGRKTIAKGYGGLAGMNANNGNFHIYTSDTSYDNNTGLPLSLRLLINRKGNVGLQGVSDPVMPLSFASIVGNKISLWGSDDSAHYGLGIQGSLLQMYSASSSTDISFGYGSSVKFTENMRIKGNGSVGIGISQPNSSALLDMQSNNKGLLIPRLTTNQRKQMASPANGLMVYDTDKSRIYMYDGIQWLPLSTGDISETPSQSFQFGLTGSKTGLGKAVSISGDYAVVTSDNYNDIVPDTAFVFYKNAGIWTLQAKLTTGDFPFLLEYGYSVAISGDQIFVGAPGRNNSKGAVYVYTRNGNAWTETNILAPTSQVSERFGESVAVDGTYAMIGAPTDGAGSIYCYNRSLGTWFFTQKIYGPPSNNFFAEKIAMSGTLAIVGHPKANSPVAPGAVYIYKRNGASWTKTQTIIEGSLIDAYFNFGKSIAIDEARGWAFVGYKASLGVSPVVGTVVGYRIFDGFLLKSIHIKPPFIPGSNSTDFGASVGISGNYLVIGSENIVSELGGTGRIYVYRNDSPVSPNSSIEWPLMKIVIDKETTPSPDNTYGSNVFVNGTNVVFGNCKLNDQRGKAIFLNLE